MKKSLSFYWRLTRPHTLPASLIPVLSGLSYSLYFQGKLHIILGLILVFCTVFIQIATNLFNEYYDFKNGIDDEKSIGIGGAIVHHKMNPKHILLAAFLLYAMAMVLGLILALYSTLKLLLVGAVCLLIGYLYTGGPHPIANGPFGEIFAGSLMGSGFFLIAFYTQTHQLNIEAFAMSIPLNVLVGLLLTANSLRDRIPDQSKGRRTLAILIGHENTLTFMLTGFFLSYFWLIILLFYHQRLFILLPLLSFPYAVKCISAFSNKNQTPKEMMKGMLFCSKTNKYFGLLYTLAIILSYIF